MTGHLALVTLFIGTYTSPGGSLGIYSATLDENTGKLSVPVLAVPMPNPSYLTESHDGHHLYAVDESTHGSVHAFSVKPGGTLIPLNSQAALGGAPCHVSVDPRGQVVLTASYNGGVIQVFPLKGGGVGPGQSVVVSGHGPIADRQEAPHMHWISIDPQGKFVYACDLGTDEVRCYPLSRGAHPAMKAPGPAGHVPPGSGPRHAVWGAAGKFLYVNGEMGNNVTTFAVDPGTGSLKALQTVSTLPPGAHSVGSSEIVMHPNGRFVYISNRGHDSIAVFAVGSDGLLTGVQVASAGVKVPRGFAIAPSGLWLVAAGQESNELRVLPIDPATGKLGSPGPSVHLSHPVCVVFGSARH